MSIMIVIRSISNNTTLGDKEPIIKKKYEHNFFQRYPHKEAKTKG